MNKKLVTGIVIGVVVTVAVCYILYLQEQNSKTTFENDLLKKKIKESKDNSSHIVDLNIVPKIIREDFKEMVKNDPVSNTKSSYDDSLERVFYLKYVIENRDGYSIFYNKNKPITKEKDLHILYDFTWYKTQCDVNKEVNNGRGPVDFKISIGLDQTLVEFKLASTRNLKSNLAHQIEIYGKANKHAKKIVCIIFSTEKDEIRAKKILKELNLIDKENIVLIDARNDNKASGSTEKYNRLLKVEMA